MKKLLIISIILISVIFIVGSVLSYESYEGEEIEGARIYEGDQRPLFDDTYDLGHPSYKWADIYGSSITVDSFSDESLIITGGDVYMKDDKTLFLDTAETIYLKYSTDHSSLVVPDSIATVGDFYLYSNTGADGSGSWLSTLGVTSSSIIITTSGSNEAILKTDYMTGGKTFQFPDISGTLLTTAGALADIDIGAYNFNVGGLLEIDSGGNDYFAITNMTEGDIFVVEDTGEVGIGTANPLALLAVAGEAHFGDIGQPVKIYTSGNDNVIEVENQHLKFLTTRSADLIRFFVNSSEKFRLSNTAIEIFADSMQFSEARGFVYDADANDLGIVMDMSMLFANSAVVFTDSGLVGIGDTTPSSILEVASNGGSDYLRLSNNSDGDILIVKDDGKVGIGKVAPAYLLDVNGIVLARSPVPAGVDESYNYLRIGTESNWGTSSANYTTGLLMGRVDHADRHVGIRYFSAAAFGQNPNMIFDISGSEVMRIDEDGNVGIGTTSPDAKLEIEEADPATNPYLRFTHTGVKIWHLVGSGSFDRDLTFRDESDTTNILTLQSVANGGNVGIGDTSPDSALEVVSTGDDYFMISSLESGDGNILLVDSAGDLTVTGGDLIFKNSGSGLPYGSFWGNEVDFTVAGGTGTFKRVFDSDIKTGQLNGIIHSDSNALGVVAFAGTYKVDWSLSLEAVSGASKHLIGAIGVDTTSAGSLTAIPDGRNHVMSTGSNENAMSGTAIINLPANSEVGVMVTIENDDTDINVQHINLTIFQVGGL